MIVSRDLIPGQQHLPSNKIEITYKNGEKEESDLYVLKGRLVKFFQYTLKQLDKYKEKLKPTVNTRLNSMRDFWSLKSICYF